MEGPNPARGRTLAKGGQAGSQESDPTHHPGLGHTCSSMKPPDDRHLWGPTFLHESVSPYCSLLVP